MARGWPFLVGAGRRRDYATLMAPDFLVAEQQHGLLNEVVRPTADGPPATVIQAVTGGGSRLWIAYVTHLVTAADLDDPEPPRDEHGRPLRLMFGLVCRGTYDTGPAKVDMERARGAALAVYRRFLDHEESFNAVTSSAMPLSAGVADAAASPVPAGWAGRGRWGWVVAAILGVIGAMMAVLLLADREEPPPALPTPSPTATPQPSP